MLDTPQLKTQARKMNSAELLSDALNRVREDCRPVVEGLTVDQLATRPNSTGNSIAWLLWHTARIIDHQVSEVAAVEQAWTAEGWVTRFGLDLPPDATGYGHNSAEVSAVRAEGELLCAYLQAVIGHTTRYLHTLTDPDYDRIVDESWDPPVTLGVRLVSIINDATQHLGQAAYVRGLLGSN